MAVYGCSGSDDIEQTEPGIEQPDIEIQNFELVDLGLSVKWANMDLGAKSYFDSGDLYAWGELETKKKYMEGNYTRPYYLVDPFTYNYKNGIGGTQWDVATQTLGRGCRLPTEKEIKELVAKCDIEQVVIDDNLYYKCTGTTGNSIYIGCDDYWLDEGDNLSDGDYGLFFRLNSLADCDVYYTAAWRGLSIRPVSEIEVYEKPGITLTHLYDETFKRNEFIIEVDANTVVTYNIKGCQYGNKTDVGMLYSTTDGILSNKSKVENGCFLKRGDNTFRNHFVDQFKEGSVYYAIPYVVIGGVSYFGEEMQFTAGSDLPRYAVGDYYPDAVNTEGVVCSIESGGTHGKIISLSESSGKWDSYSTISNFAGAFSGTNGEVNTKKITGNHFPAATWCKNVGTGWYFPARYELTAFSDNIKEINKSLRVKGATEIGGLYWSSTEHDKYQDLAYIVCLTETSYSGYDSGWSSYNTKTNVRSVRAMKKF